MLLFGHNASLNRLDGARVLGSDPRSWGPLVPKAEYLFQFGKVKAWEIYILPHQLRPLALEQLAEAMTVLSKHEYFANLDWLSFHFPTTPQSHHLTAEISQEQWRPFYQLLQVLDRFTGAKHCNLNFHYLAEATIPQTWRLEKKQQITETLQKHHEQTKELLRYAYKLRDHLNPKLGLTIENNPPYDTVNHAYHLAGLFAAEFHKWQFSGVEFCLDIQHASLVHWYRESYGFDGPIPALNHLHHRSSLGSFIELNPRYIHLAGAPNTPESFHVGTSLGAPDDDINWADWMADLKTLGEERELPLIIELVDGHLPEKYPDCQASVAYLKKLS